jgi:hypothetical protein
MTNNDANAIPHEQSEHINEAMRHLHRVDDRQVPSDVYEIIENTYWTLDKLHSRVDDAE